MVLEANKFMLDVLGYQAIVSFGVCQLQEKNITVFILTCI